MKSENGILFYFNTTHFLKSQSTQAGEGLEYVKLALWFGMKMWKTSENTEDFEQGPSNRCWELKTL